MIEFLSVSNMNNYSKRKKEQSKDALLWVTGLALDIILSSPFWRLCDNFKSPKIKSISQIYHSKTSQIDLSHISLKFLHFFKVQS